MYKIFSVDDHIVEPADLWTSRVPRPHRERAPHVVVRDDREFWVYEDQRIMTMGLGAVAGRPPDSWSSDPLRFSDMIPGCYDPAERVKDLLSQGVLASLSFPTLPRFGGMLFVDFDDKQLADVCVRAWNDFVLDEWCPAGPPGLFVPMIICQLWDPRLAAEEIARCAARGARAVAFPENGLPAGLPSYHDEIWDPIWSTCEEVELPLCMHIGSSGHVPMADRRAGPLAGITSGSIGGMTAMVNLLFSAIPVRYPDLKFVFSEAGIGWIPAILERADRTFDRHHHWAGGELRPSDVFQRNMWACMIEEPFGLSVWASVGEDKILSEIDYPHSDSTFPHTQDAYAQILKAVPDHIAEKVTHANAEKLFRWEMADPGLATVETTWTAPTGLGRTGLESAIHEQLPVGDNTRCTALVHKISAFEECGEAMGPDGLCAAGHSNERVASGVAPPPGSR